VSHEQTGLPAAPLTVLVLDDEESVRRGLARFLERNGYRSLQAATVAEAESHLQQTPIGAVIFDVRLPGNASGIDLLNELRSRKEFETIPAIILTGGTLSEAEERKILRCRGHLFYKPEGFSTLVGFLKQLTGHDQPH